LLNTLPSASSNSSIASALNAAVFFAVFSFSYTGIFYLVNARGNMLTLACKSILDLCDFLEMFRVWNTQTPHSVRVPPFLQTAMLSKTIQNKQRNKREKKSKPENDDQTLSVPYK
jgi:hypothetical protein